jgi:hypothetical protein
LEDPADLVATIDLPQPKGQGCLAVLDINAGSGCSDAGRYGELDAVCRRPEMSVDACAIHRKNIFNSHACRLSGLLRL